MINVKNFTFDFTRKSIDVLEENEKTHYLREYSFCQYIRRPKQNKILLNIYKLGNNALFILYYQLLFVKICISENFSERAKEIFSILEHITAHFIEINLRDYIKTYKMPPKFDNELPDKINGN